MSEPWLSGPIEGVDPLIAPLLHSFEQVRQELAAHTADLSPEQLWSRPFGMPSAGFHIRHLGGAADRLCTYLRGEQLNDAQMTRLRAESGPGAAPPICWPNCMLIWRESSKRCARSIPPVCASFVASAASSCQRRYMA